MANRNLVYRTKKMRYNWIPQINFNINFNEPEEEKEEIEEMLNEQVYTDEYEDLVIFFYKIRKNAKRKLELSIRNNKDKINELPDNEKELLMEHIRDRFFKKKV